MKQSSDRDARGRSRSVVEEISALVYEVIFLTENIHL